MTRVWLSLSFIFILVAIAIYFDQSFRLGASWKWEEFWHHEPFIGMAGCIGITFLAVAVAEYIRGVSKKK